MLTGRDITIDLTRKKSFYASLVLEGGGGEEEVGEGAQQVSLSLSLGIVKRATV